MVVLYRYRTPLRIIYIQRGDSVPNPVPDPVPVPVPSYPFNYMSEKGGRVPVPTTGRKVPELTPGSKPITCVSNRGTMRDERVRPVLRAWCGAFRGVTGQDYIVRGGREAGLVRRFPKHLDTETLVELIAEYWSVVSRERYIDAKSHTLSTFAARIPALLAKGIRLDAGESESTSKSEEKT